MPKQLTPEGRKGLVAALKARRQWERTVGHKTGPTTPEGKRRSGQRSLQHGMRSEGGQALMRWIASVNRLVRSL